MDPREKQFLPPHSWSVFEDLCHSLFKSVWADPLAQKNGRQGQPQNGVDVFGSPHRDRRAFQGVQCKGKSRAYGSKPTVSEIRREIAKAESFSPALEHWIFVTSAPRDVFLQEAVRRISVQRQLAGLFTVSILGWDDVQDLLVEHTAVLQRFYPEHAYDIKSLIDEIQRGPKSRQVLDLLERVEALVAMNQQSGHELVRSWAKIDFSAPRDLAPALLGKPLGPSDAAASPRLDEVHVVIAELRRVYSARLVGEPGSGKSVCAYQVAHVLQMEGWTTYRLAASNKQSTLDLRVDEQRVLFLVDDAHLLPAQVLAGIEEQAGPTRLLLTTHNAIAHDQTYRGSITIDPKRAIKTIAAAFRSDPQTTLQLVRSIDDQVGEHLFDESLDRRLDSAEAIATYPWQFCFILSGGWRRAKQAADNARFQKADFALAAAAIHQLCSRDAPLSRAHLVDLTNEVGLPIGNVNAAVDWLLFQRLLLSADDLRCPHQRFASVVLRQIVEGQDEDGRTVLGELIRRALQDASYPLAGVQILLHELRFQGEASTTLVSPKSLEPLIERAWAAHDSQTKTHAALIFAEIETYYPGWPKSLIDPRASLLADWISTPAESLGIGLGRLLNNIRNKDADFARKITSQSDAQLFGKAVSDVTPTSAFAFGELLAGSGQFSPRNAWAQKVTRSLDRIKLLKFAEAWSAGSPVYSVSRFCEAMLWWDEELALDLVEKLLPTIRVRLKQRPLEAYREIDEITSSVLRVDDVLGIYVGNHRPEARHWSLARKLCQSIEAGQLAEHISASSKRYFQDAAHLLLFLRRVAPAKFASTASGIDWDRIGQTIGDDWQNLPHEAEVLIGVAYGARSARSALEGMIDKHLAAIIQYPPRLAIVSPRCATRHIESGGLIQLSKHDHFAWQYAEFVVKYFAEERPDLLNSALSPWEKAAGAALSRDNSSWYSEAVGFIRALHSLAPQALQRIFDNVDAVGAAKGWADCLTTRPRARSRRGSSRHSAALLIDAALGRQDALGDLARQLRIRFPRSSRPVW